MPLKIRQAGMVIVAGLLCLGGHAWAASSTDIQQPPPTSYMQSKVGTPDELSPLAPAEATNVQKVGGQWTCDLNGQHMVYDDATSSWEPGPAPAVQQPQGKTKP